MARRRVIRLVHDLLVLFKLGVRGWLQALEETSSFLDGALVEKVPIGAQVGPWVVAERLIGSLLDLILARLNEKGMRWVHARPF